MSFTGQLGTTCSQLSLVELAVVPAEMEAVLVKGSGAQLRFTGNACLDAFVPIDRDRNSLVRNADGSWTETQPDQMRLHYEVPLAWSAVSITSDLGSSRNLCGSAGDVPYLGAPASGGPEGNAGQPPWCTLDRELPGDPGMAPVYSVDGSTNVLEQTDAAARRWLHCEGGQRGHRNLTPFSPPFQLRLRH